MLQAATLPLASNTVLLPPADIAAIGLSAALTAFSALTMPAPHWPETQEHSPAESMVGHTGRVPVFAGNGVALDSMREINCAGVKFPLTARISAAMPE